MVEISLWGLVVFGQVLIAVSGAWALTSYFGRRRRHRLESKLAALEKELAEQAKPTEFEESPAPPEPAAEEKKEEEAAPEPAGPPKLVLLSEADVAAATVGADQASAAMNGDAADAAASDDAAASAEGEAGEDAAEGEADGEAPEEAEASESDAEAASDNEAEGDSGGTAGGESPEQVIESLIERNQELNNELNQVLERSAELTMKIGGVRSTEGVGQEAKDKLQEVLDHLRDTDEVLVSASDKGMELDERIRFLQTLPSGHDGGGGGVHVDHVSLNEILMARADGQTEEELEKLREEVRNRLLAPPPEPVVVNKGVSEDEFKAVNSELENEKAERQQLANRLADLTDEYQRLFDQFQPMA